MEGMRAASEARKREELQATGGTCVRAAGQAEGSGPPFAAPPKQGRRFRGGPRNRNGTSGGGRFQTVEPRYAPLSA
eukprot:2538188-Rhodomonas_salina.2